MIVGGSNDNDFITTRLEIFKGHYTDDPRPRWFVNAHYSNGAESIIDDKLSHVSAVASAVREACAEGVEGGYSIPIADMSPEGLKA